MFDDHTRAAAIAAAATAYDRTLNAQLGNPPGTVLGQQGREDLATNPPFAAAVNAALDVVAEQHAATAMPPWLAEVSDGAQPAAELAEQHAAMAAAVQRVRDLCTHAAGGEGRICADCATEVLAALEPWRSLQKQAAAHTAAVCQDFLSYAKYVECSCGQWVSPNAATDEQALTYWAAHVHAATGTADGTDT